ncbi:MAG: 16S rRNA (cytosine(1402)-N(4))-methyltransferase RsmH [Jiangellales bacterium]
MPQQRHIPVMQTRVVELLAPALGHRGAVVVDATLGMGGHAAALLDACPEAHLVGIDRDPEALEVAGERLASYGGRVTLVPAVYDQVAAVLTTLGRGPVDGVLLDLGVSSLQLDEARRGFSYSADAPLDMRMDPTQGPTAADVLNTYPARDLARVLSRYGEERFARRIAAAVVTEREREPFSTSARLVDLLREQIPAASRRTGGHPAKRTFQALRIEVNAELSTLTAAVPAAVNALALAGRIVVLAYHSLEDRIVKRALTKGAASRTPVDLPVELPEHGPLLRLLTRGAERPGEQECARNPRAASAKLRGAERIGVGDLAVAA